MYHMTMLQLIFVVLVKIISRKIQVFHTGYMRIEELAIIVNDKDKTTQCRFFRFLVGDQISQSFAPFTRRVDIVKKRFQKVRTFQLALPGGWFNFINSRINNENTDQKSV